MGKGGVKSPPDAGGRTGMVPQHRHHSLRGQEGRERRKGQGKAFLCGLSCGFTASLQMQKPQRSRC